MVWKILRILSVVFAFIFIAVGISMGKEGTFGLIAGGFFLIIAVASTVNIKKLSQLKKDVASADVYGVKNQQLLVGKVSPEELFSRIGFNPEKSIIIPSGTIKTYLAADDTNKEFVVYKAPNAYRYDYNKLIDFDYEEDGETLITGKKMATLAGGVTFGLLGALVGASGKRKQKQTIDKMEIALHLNDFNNQRINIPFISMKTKKNSVIYKSAENKAEEVFGLLKYISFNQSNNSSEE